MVNFDPLTAEINWQVWGTLSYFNRYRVLAALLHGRQIVGISQTLRRWTEGATPPMLGRATITLALAHILVLYCYAVIKVCHADRLHYALCGIWHQLVMSIWHFSTARQCLELFQKRSVFPTVWLCQYLMPTPPPMSPRNSLLGIPPDYSLLPFILWSVTFAFSALTLLVGRQEEHRPVKNWVMRHWRG